MAKWIGAQIENCRLEELLWEEPPVQIYRGVQLHLKVERLVYLIHQEQGAPLAVQVEAIQQNAQAAAKLESYMGLVKIHGVNVVDGVVYFITDLVAGPSLEDVRAALHEEGRHLAPADVAMLAARVLAAMEHAYIKGGLFVSLHPRFIKFRPDTGAGSPLGYAPVLIDLGITAGLAGQFPGQELRPGHLFWAFGGLLYTLLTNQPWPETADRTPDWERLAARVEGWPAEEAQEFLAAMHRWSQVPSLSFAAGCDEMRRTLNRLADMPQSPESTVAFRAVYERLMPPKPPTPEPSAAPPQQTPAPALEVEVRLPNGKRATYPLRDEPLLVGRRPDCHIVLPDPKVSRRHLQIQKQGDQVVLIDQNSSNGVFLQGRRIPPQTPVAWPGGQTVRLGSVELRLLTPPEAPNAPRSVDDLAIPSRVYINALGREIPISDITLLPNNRLVGFYTAPQMVHEVEPGKRVSIPIYLINFGRELVNLGLRAEGAPPPWLTVNQPQFTLRSGEQKVSEITVAPPRLHLSRAGNYRLKILAADLDRLEAEGVQWTDRSVPLRVRSFVDLHQKLDAHQEGNQMTISLTAQNLGNAPLPVAVYCFCREDASALHMEPQTQETTVEPGQQQVLQIHVRPKKQALIGKVKRREVQVQITAAGQDPQVERVVFLEKSRLGF